MQFVTVILALAATAFAAPNIAERQNTGCFGAGRKFLDLSLSLQENNRTILILCFV